MTVFHKSYQLILRIINNILFSWSKRVIIVIHLKTLNGICINANYLQIEGGRNENLIMGNNNIWIHFPYLFLYDKY